MSQLIHEPLTQEEIKEMITIEMPIIDVMVYVPFTELVAEIHSMEELFDKLDTLVCDCELPRKVKAITILNIREDIIEGTQVVVFRVEIDLNIAEYYETYFHEEYVAMVQELEKDISVIPEFEDDLAGKIIDNGNDEGAE